ncbi:MAG: hypothetical protein LBV17_09560 [Treponema sp.]|nr:hypothetical protein [Treponema sp.]
MKIKKLIITILLSFTITTLNFAEDNKETSVYTLFFNIVNEQFTFPLIGFINIAGGSHNLPQIGFVNWNQKDFSTVQFGFVNTIGGSLTGLQMGFVNTSIGDIRGVQFGFINTTPKSLNGLQLGFVNTSIGDICGIQFGFINTTPKSLNGLQLGFINYTDVIENGIPIGFLSIVRNGGYKAIEFGVSEIVPFNISFKIGVKMFYTSFIVGYNPFINGIKQQVVFGGGFGAIFDLGNKFYFNPEIVSHNKIIDDFINYLSIIPYFGYNITPNLSILLSPTLTWEYNSGSDIGLLFFNIVKYSINDNNKLYLGARMALRFSW